MNSQQHLKLAEFYRRRWAQFSGKGNHFAQQTQWTWDQYMHHFEEARKVAQADTK